MWTRLALTPKIGYSPFMTRRWVALLNEKVDKQMSQMSPTQIKEWRDYFWKISLLLFPGGFIAGLAKGGAASFVFGLLAGFAGLLCTLIAHRLARES